MIKNVLTVILPLFICAGAYSQQPNYSFKHFAKDLDAPGFKIHYPEKTGNFITYVRASSQVFDIDDDSTTFMMGNYDAVLCMEGRIVDRKKEGLVSVYLIDSADHKKRYKIWEQTYANDMLNGQWRAYTLHGTIVNFKTFLNDSLNGISRDYWIDGKSVMSEIEYFNGHSKRIVRKYYQNGMLESEIPFLNDSLNGLGKKYYSDGKIQETHEFKNGVFDGARKYYYPNGQLWIEQTYKKGKNWTVVANYTGQGIKRDAGTLQNGNGTIIFYNEDGTVRETEMYKDGEKVN